MFKRSMFLAIVAMIQTYGTITREGSEASLPIPAQSFESYSDDLPVVIEVFQGVPIIRPISYQGKGQQTTYTYPDGRTHTLELDPRVRFWHSNNDVAGLLGIQAGEGSLKEVFQKFQDYLVQVHGSYFPRVRIGSYSDNGAEVILHFDLSSAVDMRLIIGGLGNSDEKTSLALVDDYLRELGLNPNRDENGLLQFTLSETEANMAFARPDFASLSTSFFKAELALRETEHAAAPDTSASNEPATLSLQEQISLQSAQIEALTRSNEELRSSIHSMVMQNERMMHSIMMNAEAAGRQSRQILDYLMQMSEFTYEMRDLMRQSGTRP